ncbi:hybrid sensor histidine kinase/response regulator [Pseudoduganella namucuonensis]|uniref:histidine kinase n=1 Tax=Pseudoduganella namucuonensis TaxID=1035707 RepID=A0A1I7LWU6_9BURK|nr:ATP-binding protein [Pseudoduganella namucuonensis]SFV14196.1 Signal transduction histidine kinase [Pseudoduganella namucuonensis]
MLGRLKPRTVRGKLVAMALATTFAALLAASGGMLLYDLDSFQQYWVDDMTTQAQIVAVVSSPALSFNDQAAARQNLAMLRVRPQIQAGAIYSANGTLFAAYAQSVQETPVFPDKPGRTGYAIEGGRLVVNHPIVENGETIGTVYLSAHYRLLDRVRSYAAILGGVMVLSLLLAALVAHRLQKGITRPLAAVTGVAREVMQRRDFSLRVPGAASGEIGTLVDAFNDMLAEVGRRAHALQEANRTLEHEMTVRQGAERALLLADRRKDEFLATLAHELRNPLAPIRTGLDILRVNADDKVAGERARAIMERQLKQMVRLVDDLLDVSRINTGKLTIKREPVALQAVVGDALELVRPLVEAQRHALHVALPAEPVYVLGDATRLAQVLSNLLNNAAKYTNRGGRLELTADVDDSAHHSLLRIRVRDNGIGVAPHMLGQIFDMFVQADTSLERSTAGLGVGLSLARKLAELHGGTITAHSDGIGRGTELTVLLPLLAPPADDEAVAPAAGASGARHRVLLADDNVDFVDSIGALLRAAGHTVEVCHDGKQALAVADGFTADYAFLDIGLPGMNGYDLARALKRLPRMRDTVMVAVTGWGQQKDRQMAFDAGFAGHLVKPVGFDQILAILAGSREGMLQL